MRPTRLTRTNSGPRRAWQAPAVTKLKIGKETRSALQRERGAELTATGGVNGDNPEPQPAAPATKLGFSFEMAFPLSVRTD
jgi:hypothetical protein